MNTAAGLPEKTFQFTTSEREKELHREANLSKAKLKYLVELLDRLAKEKASK